MDTFNVLVVALLASGALGVSGGSGYSDWQAVPTVWVH